jgi:hypothetical protein
VPERTAPTGCRARRAVKGRLNLFQAVMLRWRALHPYNAVHAMRIDRQLDAARLSTVIDGELEALGLSGFTLDAKRGRFEYAGGPPRTPLEVVSGGDEPLEVLCREIERGLNGRFPDDGPFNPFRFVAIDAGASFILALTYDHVVAAADSIVVLMHDLARAYAETSAIHGRAPLLRYPATTRRLFRRFPRATVRGLRRIGDMAANARRSIRARYPGGTDPHNGFAYRRLDPHEFAVLLRAAKAWGVTVNDLLMAILLQALEPLVGERPASERRHELAVASIVNLRRDFGYDAATTFGQFLSSFRIAHPLPPGIRLEQIARDIHAETSRIKGERLYLQTLIAIGGIGAVWRFLSPARRQGFHAKHYPAWGAITMVNVDPLWKEAGGGHPPAEYVRAVSTGPLTPLVFAVTTSAGVLHAGISYRTAAFTAQNVDVIATAIVERIRGLSA